MKVTYVETSVILSWFTEIKQRLIAIYNLKTAADKIFYYYSSKKKKQKKTKQKKKSNPHIHWRSKFHQNEGTWRMIKRLAACGRLVGKHEVSSA